MKVTIATGRGEEVFYGVTDFEMLPDSEDGDLRLYAPKGNEPREKVVAGDLQGAIDAAMVPHDEVPDGSADVVNDWRTEDFRARLGAGVYAP